MRIYIRHKTGMTDEFYDKYCKKCKYLDSSDKLETCTYPYADKCQCKSFGYKLGLFVAYAILIIGIIAILCLCGALWNFVIGLFR